MLKQIVLRKKIETLRAQMNGAEETRAELEKRRAALVLREEELEKAVAEVTEETPAEDQAALDEETAKWEAEDEALAKEESEHAETTRKLQEQIDDLTRELDELNERSQKAAQNTVRNERKVEETMNTRKFFGMTIEQRDAFFKREDVKSFLQRVRELGGQQRSVTGAEMLIPTVVLDLIRENVESFSKLYKHVNVRRVPGKARQTVMGTIPEAVWTEMCGKLNELNLTFSGVEVDGYKVGGYIAVCNALLEDSDIALATEIISVLGQSIGIALDKAIIYGTGVKMPTGILTRLVQTEDPGNEKSTLPWANLSASNVIAVSGKTDAALFKAIVEASGAAKGKYSNGTKFWAMNEATYTKLVANSLSINAAGAVTAGQMGTMPVIGGAIEVLSFMPDDVIVGGYGDLYLLAERAGAAVAQSEHVRFTDDQTVFRGTARYDGLPVIAEGFIAIGIGGTKPTAAGIAFAEDRAN